ncbi:Sterol O-acyltransferase [Penicillium chermesinum]|uniref:O-acyltransferase n=1 Tax=Penicillium chermesinum TaxID=63820 RepID=A0A9W9NZU4_9EURO|nr:Sterol O-acyltransferase [Penicillium chermesinum]KAJ5232769.1 Sterol O-acyltransferase [Penicillium chermesinum]
MREPDTELLSARLAATGGPDSDSGQNEKESSVSVRLQQTDQAGQYLLTTEDAHVMQELLRHQLSLQKSGSAEKSRFVFRDLAFTRQLSSLDRQNPTASASEFRGFFTLFWLCVAMMLLRTCAKNWREHGSIIVWGNNEIIRLMFSKDVLVLGISDFVLCWSTLFCLGLQRAISAGYLHWDGLGWVIQNIWQTAYLAIAIWWTYHRDWPWTHTVFMVLHCLTMLMKQHSYGAYNGHLSVLYRKRELLSARLRRLETYDDQQSVPAAHTSALQSSVDAQISSIEQLAHRRLDDKKAVQASQTADQLLSLSETIEKKSPLNTNQIAALRSFLEREVDLLSEELQGQFSASHYYPRNLTLEYPRTEKINWSYVAEKTTATFGTIMVMIAVSQHWIYPVVMKTVQMKEEGLTAQQRLQEFPWILSDLSFPFLLEYLLAFYVIWECVLNVLAEVTRFADRKFYADWWNCVSWDQFARDWNRPVADFLRRHVYHSSISAFHLSRVSASFVTFLLSACVHELVMLCIFRRLRGYLLILQMSQLPLVSLSRTRFLRGRKVIGNIFFWVGIFTGPSLLCSLYLII